MPMLKLFYAALKASEEEGSVLPGHFIHHSNLNNLDERKAVWKVLDKTLTESSLNNTLITEMKFTKALFGLSKVTAHGPDEVKSWI